MRRLAQVAVVGVIALCAVAIFAPKWIAPRVAAQVKEGETQTVDHSVAESETQSDNRVASTEDANQATSPARTKLVRSLKSAAQVIDEKIPGNDVSVTSQVVDTLDQADRILSDAQLANRQSLASANRQVRLPGRSPQLLIVVVPGLQQSDVEAVDTDAHPGLRRLKLEGTTISGLRPVGTSTRSAIQTIAYAQAVDVSSQSIPPSLMSMLWHSGYDTTMVGDLSWTISVDPQQIARHGMEQSFGLKTAAEVAEAFPKQIWSNETRVRIPANESVAEVSADQLFTNEAALKLAGNPQQRRPQAVILTLPESNSVAVDAAARADRLLVSLMQKLDGKRLSDRTFVVVVGLPSANSIAARPVALVRWPYHVPAGKVIEQECDAVDLTPTILALTQSQRVSNMWPGKSQADAWQSKTEPARGARRSSPAAQTTGALPKA